MIVMCSLNRSVRHADKGFIPAKARISLWNSGELSIAFFFFLRCFVEPKQHRDVS